MTFLRRLVSWLDLLLRMVIFCDISGELAARRKGMAWEAEHDGRVRQ